MLARKGFLSGVLARVLVALLLFGQALDVAQACLTPAQFQLAFELRDCHEPANPNHCLEQCAIDGKSPLQAQIAIPDLPRNVVLLLPEERSTRDLGAGHTRTCLTSNDPPPQLRFCSFLL